MSEEAVKRDDLKKLILDAIASRGGSARIPEIGKHIWDRHEPALKASGEFFYVWQYELRWASNQLAREGKLDKTSTRGVWKKLP
ncbi:hypothetical protein [Bradyrhizobium elkanii]|uniref:hypothetical protein n=1 Tax=Bradyrhizobium elkanii TaxID=29448 RepID=UPI0020A1676B|nr:hypothetical protein [Bradyrhizobium elkanii]MCP1972529.1 hypothetical protein [Bradyrhizobium elkanii]MCS3519726.1 hypothetical protein [Bradyrhizobium elkanii]MCS4067381.1 hypothetical protein [Bradyrhizobium elkanii]MCS4082917.1 hypothetical protein [Bradyrhizobium elkanii]MCS4105962.1 hypothetical protein [Bradyrhizobium elkanii]